MSDFLKRFATKVDIHKWIDAAPDDAVFLILERSCYFHVLGDLTVAQAIYMVESFKLWLLDEGKTEEERDCGDGWI